MTIQLPASPTSHQLQALFPFISVLLWFPSMLLSPIQALKPIQTCLRLVTTFDCGDSQDAPVTTHVSNFSLSLDIHRCRMYM